MGIKILAAVVATCLSVGAANASVIHNLAKTLPANEANELSQVTSTLAGVMVDTTGYITLGRIDAGNIGLGAQMSDMGIGEELSFDFSLATFDVAGDPMNAGGDLVAGSGFVLEAVLLVDGGVSSLWYDGMFDDMFIVEGASKRKSISHLSFYGRREMPPSVPLPAAGWMLLAGVGGLAAAKRRKKS